MTQITKSVLVLLLLLFYGCIFVFYGYAFSTSDTDIGTSNQSLGTFTFSNVITGIMNVPFWINAVIFTPLVLTLTFLIVTSLPTFNGGS